MSLKDDLILEYFRLGTNLSEKEIETIAQTLESGANPMATKKQLGLQIVTELYDEQAALAAEQHFSRSIQEKRAPDNIQEIIFATKSVNIEELITKLTAMKAVPSKSEARRLMNQNAFYLDDNVVDPSSQALHLGNDAHILRIGKRKYIRLKAA